MSVNLLLLVQLYFLVFLFSCFLGFVWWDVYRDIWIGRRGTGGRDM